MSVSVVIQNLMTENSEDGADLFIKGTVGGVAHTWHRRRPFNQLDGTVTPAVLATEFMNNFNELAAAILLITNITPTHVIFDNRTSLTVTFGGTPVAEVGYDFVTVTATIGGVSTVILMRRSVFLNLSLQADFIRFICQRLYRQNQYDVISNSTGRDYIATFSI